MREKERKDPVLYDRDLEETETGNADHLTESSGRTEDRGGCLLSLWYLGFLVLGVALIELGAPEILLPASFVIAVAPMAVLMLFAFGYSIVELWREYGVFLLVGAAILAAISYAGYKLSGDCDSEMNMAGQVGCVSY